MTLTKLLCSPFLKVCEKMGAMVKRSRWNYVWITPVALLLVVIAYLFCSIESIVYTGGRMLCILADGVWMAIFAQVEAAQRELRNDWNALR